MHSTITSSGPAHVCSPSSLPCLSLLLICAAAWKTHIRETWLRIFWGKESCSRPHGDRYLGGPAREKSLLFFPLKQIYNMSESDEAPALQGPCIHPGFWLAALSGLPDSSWVWKLPCYFIGQPRQTMLADLPGDLQKLCNSVTHCTAMGFISLMYASELPFASGHVPFLGELPQGCLS